MPEVATRTRILPAQAIVDMQTLRLRLSGMWLCSAGSPKRFQCKGVPRSFRVPQCDLHLPQNFRNVWNGAPCREKIIGASHALQSIHQLIVTLDDTSNPAEEFPFDGIVRPWKSKQLLVCWVFRVSHFISGVYPRPNRAQRLRYNIYLTTNPSAYPHPAE